MEVFREKAVAEPEVEAEVVEKPVYEEIGTPITPSEKPMDNISIENLTVWEGENKKKYVHEYFNVHNIASDFTVKMPTGEIDKFIKEQLEERGYEKTTKNYRSILAEIEQEIGSDKLELFKRFNKLTGYIRVLRKLYATKKMKEKYLNTDISA